MNLNVNYTSLYNNGIDKSMLKEVSNEILNRAAQKSSQYNPTLASTQQVNSVAKPAELGIDLYQGKIDTTVQKQIAMNNVYQYQLNTETLQSIQFLNSQAAIKSKIDGKYAPVINEIATETQKVAESNKSQFMSIFTLATAKDKNGSNPFYHGELLLGSQGSKKEDPNETVEQKIKSIFI